MRTPAPAAQTTPGSAREGWGSHPLPPAAAAPRSHRPWGRDRARHCVPTLSPPSQHPGARGAPALQSGTGTAVTREGSQRLTPAKALICFPPSHGWGQQWDPCCWGGTNPTLPPPAGEKGSGTMRRAQPPPQGEKKMVKPTVQQKQPREPPRHWTPGRALSSPKPRGLLATRYLPRHCHVCRSVLPPGRIRPPPGRPAGDGDLRPAPAELGFAEPR